MTEYQKFKIAKQLIDMLKSCLSFSTEEEKNNINKMVGLLEYELKIGYINFKQFLFIAGLYNELRSFSDNEAKKKSIATYFNGIMIDWYFYQYPEKLKD